MQVLSVSNPFGAPVYWVETTTSTMDEARRLTAEGAVHGTVIAADFQAAGRGRVRDRPWLGRPGENLFATIALRYPGFAAIPGALTLKAGLALALGIEDFAPSLAGRVELNWPNDIMLLSGPSAAGKAQAAGKAAGILTETDGKNVYVGFGVNLLQTEFPEELRNKAASIALALSFPDTARGPPASGVSGPRSPEDRFILLEKILARLFQELEMPGAVRDTGGRAAGTAPAESWLSRLKGRLYMRGKPIRFIAGAAGSGRVVEGILSGIGKDGELLILPPGAPRPLAFFTGELDVYG
jgi:BirA family biotin operon repressor/biotin-[acetyl-CoA-carboxylase] ligase